MARIQTSLLLTSSFGNSRNEHQKASNGKLADDNCFPSTRLLETSGTHLLIYGCGHVVASPSGLAFSRGKVQENGLIQLRSQMASLATQFGRPG